MTDLVNIFISLLTVLSCMLLAHLVCKLKSHRYLERNTRLGCIDGLRGYLAIGVFIHHFAITFHWKNGASWGRPPEDYFTHFGQSGVAIFFMITGFLFVRKILDVRGKIDWRKFYINRAFRILPLYIACLLMIVLIVLIQSNFLLQTSISQLIVDISRWFLFIGGSINGYGDTKKIIASVDWTLKYEWLFYFSIPMLAIILKSRINTMAVCSLVVLGSVFPYQLGTIIWDFTWKFSSFPFILFMIGGLTAKLSMLKIEKNMDHPLVTIIALLSLGVLVLVFDSSFGFFQSVLLAGFFVPIALGNSLFGVLRAKMSIFLGEISYSIYLAHGMVLFFLFTMSFPNFVAAIAENNYMFFMPLVGVLVILFSWFTFSYVEKPMMMVGRNVANK